MKRIVRLTESDLTRIVRRTLNEMREKTNLGGVDCFRKHVVSRLPESCKPKKDVVIEEKPTNCMADLTDYLQDAIFSGDFKEVTGLTALIACLNHENTIKMY